MLVCVHLKAGITTTLNSRCSVLAAANSVFGRWDDTKGEDNIDFMPTILSRFDMIFIIKDQHDQQRDMVGEQNNSCLQIPLTSLILYELIHKPVFFFRLWPGT